MFEMGAKFEDGWQLEKGKEKEVNKEIKAPQKHQLYMVKEKRKGKVVTIVKPFFIEKKEFQGILKTLKKNLSTGGTLKENALEFQGDIQERLREALMRLDFGFKR